MQPIQLTIFVTDPLFFKVSRLERGSKSRSRAEESPYVLSQMLAPFQMLLAGILLGFASLLAEMKSGKKVMEGSARSRRPRSRPIVTPEAAFTSKDRRNLNLMAPKIHKMVRFESKFE